MTGPQRLLGASGRLLRCNQVIGRSQWHRQLSQHSGRANVPQSISRPLQSSRRYQSTSTQAAAQTAKETAATAAKATASGGSRIIAYAYGTGLVLLLSFGFLYITDTRASLHQYIAVPLIRLIHSDPEDAHHAGIRYIKGLYDFNLHPRERGSADQELGDLKVEVFGHILDNPIGTSAGIDKNGEIPSALMALGPAVVEVGGVTPLPQLGNEKPRVFRIPSQNALINRYGLNSDGVEHVAMQLRERVRSWAYSRGLGLGPDAERLVLDGEVGVPPGSLVPGKVLAVQVAKNKSTLDNDIAAVARDYAFCVEHLAKYADILVVNVSSPNTPGLRDLQATAPLTAILSAVVNTAKSIDRKTKPAVMVKVSPDEDSDAQIEGICSAVWASGVDGVIVGNTTKRRPDPLPKGYIMPAKEANLLKEMGGYSGPQMFERTLDLVKRYRVKLDQGPQDDRPTIPSPSPPQYTQQYPAKAPPVDDRRPSPSSGFGHDLVDESLQRDVARLKPLTPKAEEDSKQPLVQLPDRHSSQDTEARANEVTKGAKAGGAPSEVAASSAEGGQKSSARQAAEGALQKIITDDAPNGEASRSQSASKQNEKHAQQSSKQSEKDASPKVIFATGGITDGEQCLEILNAGASVCQVYTAMMYGGVGTITRMKSEMRQAIKNQSQK